MRPSAAEVVARRRRRRAALLDEARQVAAELPSRAGVQAVVVFGSVARGDFHDDSDIDLLVVAEHLPARAPDRFAALGAPWPRVETVAWTPAELHERLAGGDPIALEACQHGVWLRGEAPTR